MNKQNHMGMLAIAIIITSIIIAGSLVSFSLSLNSKPVDVALAAQFEALKKQGNSSCSGSFTQSIASMNDMERLQGSCCSPMDFHRYQEQVEGLKKYKNVPEIPPDPYDIPAGLAKQLSGYYDNITLNAEQQKSFDYAMKNSHEKGPCCCKCWRWYMYGGLGKYLIQAYDFSGEQVTEVWNLSDGCGGSGSHSGHSYLRLRSSYRPSACLSCSFLSNFGAHKTQSSPIHI